MSIVEILFLIGRVLFGGYFIMAGMNHVTKTPMLAGYAASKGVPNAKLAVIASGLLIIFGGLGILLGVFLGWSVALIALFLIVVSFKMHAFWNETDANMKMSDKTHFMKNMALLGGALMTLAVATPWIWSLSF
jgi:uncharacterized membrane protein YphA (DoxX/SURF4 family)